MTNPGTPAQSLAVQGSYQYQSPEGPVQVAYIADDYGYQPTGNVVHPSIQRAVAYQVALAKSEPPGLYNEAGFPVGPVGPLGPLGPLGPGGPGGPGGPLPLNPNAFPAGPLPLPLPSQQGQPGAGQGRR